MGHSVVRRTYPPGHFGERDAVELRDYLRGRKPGPFQPIPFYSKVGDMLEVYWEEGAPDGGYSDPINNELTVIRAVSDNRPIGVKVYGVRFLVGK